MGNSSSKKSKRSKRQRKPQNNSERVITLTTSADRVISRNAFDEEQVNILKKELEETPQIFVLNNVLLSLMFFENYEREKQKVVLAGTASQEKDINSILRQEQMECIIPDVILERVNKYIRYRPLHGPDKAVAQPLVSQRLFVIYNNIEVLESKDLQHYTMIDKPSYQVYIEHSEHSGFVKLKHLETISKEDSDENCDSRVATPPAIAGTSSNTNDSEIYEYTTITDMKTPKPLDITKYEEQDTLPKTCFTSRQIKKLDDLSSDSDSDSEDYGPPEDKEALFETVPYMSSSGFMRHFQNAIFPNALGKALGFDQTEINLANAIPGTVFCNLIDEDDMTIPCEVIPSVATHWPHEQAYEFTKRGERPIMRDRFGQMYQWPTDEMVADIKSMNCIIIPRGNFQKRGENKDSDIEWEISFPKAQRYLDARMTHAQMKSFLCLLTLYKAYVEPVTKQHGLLPEHIRYHMYWECESNPKDWPEHRLGTKVVKLIERLNERLSKTELPDFFMKKKNVFDNIPNKYLKHAQKIMHNILESPAIYFIGALRNIRYRSGKFYPSLEYKKLYEILTTENSLSLGNIPQTIAPNYRNVKRKAPQPEADANFKKELNWRYKNERMNREKFLQKIRLEKERVAEDLNKRKSSIDSIDYEWECKEIDIIKSRKLLLFFCEHYLEMVKKSRRFSPKRQSLLLLKQAYYLAKILEETDGLVADARDLLAKIAKEEENVEKSATEENFDYLPPSTPKRNSYQFNWDITQQVKNNHINLHNLNKSFNTAGVSGVAQPKKYNSNLKSKPSTSRSVVFSPTVEKN